jgi:broad specificity phosphatase PhoE
MKTRLILIRHGITRWNKEGRYCGRIDVNLSREGRSQAKKLKTVFKAISVDRIYCSDKKRALQTCRIIFGKTKFTRLHGLREINFGAIEGLRHQEIMKKYGSIYQKWIKDPYQNHLPAAEKMNDFKKRVCSVINKIARRNPGKTVAIVCHGGGIGIFVSSIYKSNDFWHYVPKAASITMVTFRDGSWPKREVSPAGTLLPLSKNRP